MLIPTQDLRKYDILNRIARVARESKTERRRLFDIAWLSVIASQASGEAISPSLQKDCFGFASQRHPGLLNARRAPVLLWRALFL